MKKYKIYVYAIAKNEEKFVDRWVKSMSEADDIFVLDTGSTDKTVEKLKKHNVNVFQKQIIPWRFDAARNESLNIIPDKYDIYVCTDLDEVFIPGWRKKIEENWSEGLTRIRYNYNWKLDKNNNPLINFYIDKIHIKDGYTWKHPVHEVLSTDNDEKYKTIDEITLNHYPDIKKSRSNYLPLLELSVKEDPTDDRNMHYLGREYMYYGKWKKCIKTLKKHLNLPKALWRDERCASMRFIARSYKNLNNIKEAKKWLKKAILEAPYLRDPLVELGILEYENNNYKNAIYYLNEALKIKEHPKTYINEMFSFNETPYDILSICYFNVGNYNKSLENVKIARKINKNDKRLRKNEKIIKKYIN